MDFGSALSVLKNGGRVAREGWNGKGMWLKIQFGTVIRADEARSGVAKVIADQGAKDVVILPHIDMHNAKGQVVVGWLASQEDMLAEDWIVIDGWS